MIICKTRKRLTRKPIKRTYAPKQRKTALRRKKSTNSTWSLKKADTAFSEQIRRRDGKCLFPACWRTTFLQCSHYIGRATKTTRFDTENCITLCWLHHYKDKQLGYEYQKQRLEVHGWDGQYTLFMKTYLGEQRFAALIERSKNHTTQKAAIQNYQNTLTLPTPLQEI